MKVALVNTYDEIGGAARAALRLHKALLVCGQPVRTYVHQKDSNAADIIRVLAETPAEKAAAEAIETVDSAERAAYPSMADNRHPLFTSERAGPGPALVNRLEAVDIINLHWVRGLLDWEHFFATRPPGQAVVWTMHDTLAFTGGCHYPGTCGHFTAACGSCHHLGSSDPDDMSARILRRKREAISRFTGPFSLVAPSRWMADMCQRSALFAGRAVTVIPNGIDTDIFRPGNRTALREELGLPIDIPIVLFVASVLTEPRKGLTYVLEALERLGETMPVILATAGHAPPVSVTGVQHIHLGIAMDDEQLRNFYVAADVLILPSLEDNLPNTAMEALACGTPVVGFPSGGIPDLVDMTCGELAPALSGEGLALALRRLLNDPIRHADLCRGARRKAEREYALAVHGRRYLDHYQSILSARPTGESLS
ncbi:glycosyltransferase [Niveispirillum cyanobacteriorum]|uniref:Glycosyl transferase family 1 n=1 Tax=Niveispirillum cyanobacteriorum TaxID=1612173 RepID=A0A2K9NLG7_9PROT|nr:glycosyltransferase [Niveispirillum cyanobacteriorum]AUN33917.1 glycosyl transferase family 1 [Niveispirillum cyanobacteriorum]GGE86017.1 glycosyl transferase family 1 [Niveispirillum cyanobacteriorum]